MRHEILSLQAELMDDGLTACLVPSSDFHQSEYVHPFFRFRRYLSGFTGSAGTLLVTTSKAFLWTDSRYYLQAERELAGSGITLMKQGTPGVPEIPAWIAQNLPEGALLAADTRTVSAAEGSLLARILRKKGGDLVGRDLAEEVWKDRPPLGSEPVYELPSEYTGRTAAEKLALVRAEMAKKGADVHLLTSLDDIAWILNLRGGDVAYTPVFYSCLVITAESAVLYAIPEAFSYELRRRLIDLGMTLKPYDSFFDDVPLHCSGRTVLADDRKISYALLQKLSDDCKLVKAPNPSTLMKAVKDPVEIENLRAANVKDGLVMVNFIRWIKENVAGGQLTELSVGKHLDEARRKAGALDLSFATIAGYGPHGAVVHYTAAEDTSLPLAPEGLLLVDSGAHYPEGTTDITRTIVCGPLTEQMKRDFTLVLKGHIALASAVFPAGCRGEHLDVLAHLPLWKAGLDYGHGTGHGVGFRLSVHEGPNHFSWRRSARGESCALAPGMVTTDEPGLYIAGSHGIRHENDLLCVEKETTEAGRFLGFEPLTLCPFDREALLPELLTFEEKDWLNAYHEHVWQALKDGLDTETAAWLRAATMPVE